MGSWNETPKTETSLPLLLVVDREGTGGVAGLAPAPTVRIRDPKVAGSYYDWADNTFKTAGWLARDGAMADVGGGHYQRNLDVSSFPMVVGESFVAEYRLAVPPDLFGTDSELFLISDLREDAALVRKYHTNRMHESSGSPGKIELYDDDDTTLLRTHLLRDEQGGAIAPTVLTPARRAKGT